METNQSKDLKELQMGGLQLMANLLMVANIVLGWLFLSLLDSDCYEPFCQKHLIAAGALAFSLTLQYFIIINRLKKPLGLIFFRLFGWIFTIKGLMALAYLGSVEDNVEREIYFLLLSLLVGGLFLLFANLYRKRRAFRFS